MATKTEIKTQTIDIEDTLSQLHKEKIESLQRAKNIDDQHTIVWKQEIETLAHILEQEYLIQGQKWLIPTICTEISHLYLNHGISIWNIVDRYLDHKYKQEHSSIQSRTEVPDQIEQDSIEMLQQLTRNIGTLPRDAIPELIAFADKFSKGARRRAALEKIPLTPDENASNIDQINDSKEDDREHVTIDRPQARATVLFEAIERKIQRWQTVQQRVYEFPPEILEKAQVYADALDASDLWMDPIADLKYSKSLQGWFKAESFHDTYGKHAAGVMSYSVTNLCGRCSNEKTKYWVRMEPIKLRSHSVYACVGCNQQTSTICPICNNPMTETDKPNVIWQCPECESTNTAIRRNLTREQIGDKSSIIVDIAEKFLMAIPDFAAFCNWYHEWLEPYLSGRKTRLSSDLSERA